MDKYTALILSIVPGDPFDITVTHPLIGTQPQILKVSQTLTGIMTPQDLTLWMQRKSPNVNDVLEL